MQTVPPSMQISLRQFDRLATPFRMPTLTLAVPSQAQAQTQTQINANANAVLQAAAAALQQQQQQQQLQLLQLQILQQQLKLQQQQQLSPFHMPMLPQYSATATQSMQSAATATTTTTATATGGNRQPQSGSPQTPPASRSGIKHESPSSSSSLSSFSLSSSSSSSADAAATAAADRDSKPRKGVAHPLLKTEDRTGPTAAAFDLDADADADQKEAGNDNDNSNDNSNSNGGGQRRSKPRFWSEAEDRALCKAVERYGECGWRQIARVVGAVNQGGRTADQCCQRWHRVLAPAIKRTEWTREEDAALTAAVAVLGPAAWRDVALRLPGRTDQQCRYRHRQLHTPRLAPSCAQRAAHARRDYVDRVVHGRAREPILVWHLRSPVNAAAAAVAVGAGTGVVNTDTGVVNHVHKPEHTPDVRMSLSHILN